MSPIMSAEMAAKVEQWDLVEAAIAAYDRAYTRAYNTYSHGIHSIGNPWQKHRGRAQLAVFAALMVLREKMPTLAAALWQCDPEYAFTILLEVQRLIWRGVLPDQDADEEYLLQALDHVASAESWCDAWHDGARPSLHKHLGVFRA